ncbi:class I SAM-dependent methyltransferase [uncultured Thermanaerothrix sp.]|uniref:class I SAM-dependent methyltransferase n=1 Tax=uncultured Thermanaerothrix sp. TaxID=1195149 RepID=UPI002625B4DD|nr:class I SAM-dependent methyltransferase [uncultured Thermanaerothrix sp.]
MPREDAERWNIRYRTLIQAPDLDRPRDLLVTFADLLPSSGWALDLATGLGANAIFLAQRGLTVVAIDISWTALQFVHRRCPSLCLILADLTEHPLPPMEFDVILNFYYLERSLFPQFYTHLKPGGWLFIETLTEGMDKLFPGQIAPAHLLKEGELYETFKHWKIIYYNEGITQGHSGLKAVASLVAQRPS